MVIRRLRAGKLVREGAGFCANGVCLFCDEPYGTGA